MTKQQILEMTGLTEKEFYKKYPTKEAFEKGGSILPTPTMDIFGMMGMPYVNKFAMGATVPCDNPPCPPTIGSRENPRQVSSIPEGYTQDPNNPRLYVKSTQTSTPGTTISSSSSTSTPKRRVVPSTSTSTGTTTPSARRKVVPPVVSNQSDYVYMQDNMTPMVPLEPDLSQSIEMPLQPNSYKRRSKPPTGDGGRSDFNLWLRRQGKAISVKCDKVMDSTGKFVDKCFEFEDGGTIPGGEFDVKAPMYDQTELNPNINTNVYGSGAGIHIKPENRGKFTAWASAHNMSVPEAANRVMANTDNYSPSVVKMANFAKNAAKWKHGYGGYYESGGYTPMYAKGSYIPMYGLGNTVAGIGAGLYGTGEGLLDTLTMGATDQLTDMGYQGLQELGGADNIKDQNAARGFATTAGAVTGAVLNPASMGTAVAQGSKGLGMGIANVSDDPNAQTIGNLLTTGGNLASMFVNPAGAAGGSGAANIAQNSGFITGAADLGKSFNMVNQFMPFLTQMGQGQQQGQQQVMGYGGNIRKMPIFANGGTTVGNVESNELLIDPYTYGAGGVPKVLADYKNLPSHPKDGSIDDRGTVTLPVDKFIVTKKMRTMFDKAEQSNDGLLAAAVTNKVKFDKNKKEQAEMQAATTAYEKFMAKYGGTIQKMYACGGKTYGCGGMVKKYDVGASVFGPTILNSYLATPTAGNPIPYAPDFDMSSLSSIDTEAFPTMQRGPMTPYWEPTVTPAQPFTSTNFERAAFIANNNMINPQSGNVNPNLPYNPYSNPMVAVQQIDPGVTEQQLFPQHFTNNNDDSKNKNTNKPGTKGGGEKPDRTNQILGALQLGAPLYNLGRGIFGKKMIIPEDLGMVAADIKAPVMTDAQGRRLIGEELNRAKYNLSQMGGANVLAGLTSLGTAGMKSVSDYVENMRNKQAALDFEASVRNKGIQQQNAQQRLQNLMSQAQIDAAKDNLISTGVGQVGEAAGQIRKERTMKDVYGDLFANYDYVNGRWVPRTT